MPYPENMCYVRWEFGWQPTGSSGDIEIQDFGMWGEVRQEGTGAFPDWQSIVDGLAPLARDAFATNVLPSSFASPVNARRVIVYHYDQPHLNWLHRAESAFEGATEWKGGGSPVPPQLSICVSTLAYAPGTAVAKAARRRGRFYLPTPSQSVMSSGDGELASGTQGTLLGQVVDFFNDLTSSFDTEGGPLLDMHFRPMVSSVAGLMANDIQAVRVGRVIDTQRRRRNKLPEAYQVATINT